MQNHSMKTSCQMKLSRQDPFVILDLFPKVNFLYMGAVSTFASASYMKCCRALLKSEIGRFGLSLTEEAFVFICWPP